MTRKRTWTNEQLIRAVASSNSYLQVLKQLGLREAGGNYKQLKLYIRELDLNTDHFSSQRWRKGSKTSVVSKKPLEEILVENSTYQTYKLKLRLISEKILEYKCSQCGISSWLGNDIALELDHENGICNDHRLQNLRLLCPNCHSQTSSWRGKNKCIKNVS